MAGEYDKKFDEITEILQTMQKSVGQIDRMQGGFDEMSLELRDMRKDLRSNTDRLEAVVVRLGTLEKKVDTFSGQFNDVAVMAIKDHSRIDNIDQRVSVRESKAH